MNRVVSAFLTIVSRTQLPSCPSGHDELLLKLSRKTLNLLLERLPVIRYLFGAHIPARSQNVALRGDFLRGRALAETGDIFIYLPASFGALSSSDSSRRSW